MTRGIFFAVSENDLLIIREALSKGGIRQRTIMLAGDNNFSQGYLSNFLMGKKLAQRSKIAAVLDAIEKRIHFAYTQHHLDARRAQAALAVLNKIRLKAGLSTKKNIVDYPGQVIPVTSPMYLDRLISPLFQGKLRVSDWVRRSMEYRNWSVVIKGPTGTGKSTIVRALASYVSDEGPKVHFLDCRELAGYLKVIGTDALGQQSSVFRYWADFLCESFALETAYLPSEGGEPYWEYRHWVEQVLRSKDFSKDLLVVDSLSALPPLVVDQIILLATSPGFGFTFKTWCQRLCLVVDESSKYLDGFDVITIGDFTSDEVAALAVRFGILEKEEGQVYEVTHGHPYLTHRVLASVDEWHTLDEVLAAAQKNQTPP